MTLTHTSIDTPRGATMRHTGPTRRAPGGYRLAIDRRQREPVHRGRAARVQRDPRDTQHLSTGGGTRRIQLVREEGRDVSS